MSNSKRWLLLGPIVSVAGTIAFTLNYEVTLASNLLISCYVFCILAMYGFIALYLRDVWKNDALSKERKVLWTVLLIYASVPIQIFYWFRHLKNQ